MSALWRYTAPMLMLLLAACLGEERPPDVVLVLVDTLRADALGFSGAPFPSTPYLDQLVADEAAWFSQAYACSSWTLPSTVCLLTGQPPWEHRVVRDAKDFNLYGRLGPEASTLATQLKAQGYRSAAFMNNTFMAPEFGLSTGFDTYSYVGASNIDHRSAEDTVREALTWLDQSDQPALLLLHFMEPHYDYTPPEGDKGRFTAGLPNTLGDYPFGETRVLKWMHKREQVSAEDRAYVRAAYQEELLAVDRATQALIEGLKARGRWDKARFALTADHGEELWDYGGFEHGHTTRSAVTHIPLIVHLPGTKPGRNSSVVSHLDIFQLLLGGQGAVVAAALGQELPPRVAISQDLLYNLQELSITDGKQRLTVQLDTHQATLWALDERGMELEPPISDDPSRRSEAEGLYNTLLQVRGGLEPTVPLNPSRIQDSDTFEKLRALGYIRE